MHASDLREVVQDVVQRYQFTKEETQTYMRFLQMVATFEEGMSRSLSGVDSILSMLMDALNDAKVCLTDTEPMNRR